jgi:hypothetical protein
MHWRQVPRLNPVELKFVQAQLRDADAAEQFDQYLSRVDWIEEQAAKVQIMQAKNRQSDVTARDIGMRVLEG